MKYKRNKNRKDYSKKLKELELERFLKRKDKIIDEELLNNTELDYQLRIAILKDNS